MPNRAVSEADLVLYIGSNTGDVVSHNWKVPKQGTPIIQIDIDPIELGRNYPNTLAIMADVKKAVRRLVKSMKTSDPKTQWSKRAQQLVKDWKAELEPVRNSDAVPMMGIRVEHPEEISSAMETALKADRPVVIELITDPDCIAPIARD